MSKKKYQNIFIEGMMISFENADKWMQEAELLYKLESYGHACAIIVHAIEALAQAIYCYGVLRGVVDEQSKEFKDVFFKHGRKISVLTNVLATDKIVRTRLPELSNGKSPFEFILELGKNNIFLREVENLVNKNRETHFRDIMELRNNGIYVNFDQDTREFSSPNNISKESYIQIKENVDLMYDRMLAIITFCETYEFQS